MSPAAVLFATTVKPYTIGVETAIVTFTPPYVEKTKDGGTLIAVLKKKLAGQAGWLTEDA